MQRKEVNENANPDNDAIYLKEIRGNIVRKLSALGNITLEQSQLFFETLERLRDADANTQRPERQPMRAPE